MTATDLVGWAASAILLATLAAQIRVQWRERRTEGVSSWLFVGQFAASCGFLLYSWLVGNTIFVATNAMLAVTALIGQALYRWNVRTASKRKQRPPQHQGQDQTQVTDTKEKQEVSAPPSVARCRRANIRHSRESGNPVAFQPKTLDSGVRRNDDNAGDPVV